MFDYVSWVQRAEAFIKNVAQFENCDELQTEIAIAPPLTASELQQLQENFKKPLSLELQRFWMTASRHCHWHCYLENDSGTFYSAPTFLDATELLEETAICRDWADGCSEDPAQEALWLQSVPFISMRNGDYLGLFAPTSHDDPPVAYLSHDDVSRIIAPSFTEFLKVWEQLCYIGPEIWELEKYLDSNGMWDASTARAEQLRSFLQTGIAPPSSLPTQTLQEQCISNMKQINLAAVMYIQDNDGVLPNVWTWCDELSVYDHRLASRLFCPASGWEFGYTMNANLSRVKYSDIQQPERTVLFFESDTESLNSFGTSILLPRQNRHNGCSVVVFADSNIQVVSEEMQQDLKWTVD